MKNFCMAAIATVLCVNLSAEITRVCDGGRYILTVPEGETYEITSDDLAEFGTNTLFKVGGGTLVAGGVMTNFTGDIHITNGIYQATKAGALGPTEESSTYVYGFGTLQNQISAPNTYTSTGGYPSFGLKEHLYVEGSGYKGLGAIYNRALSANLVGYLILTGDTLFTQKESLDVRYTTFDMRGYKLTISNATEETFFRIVATGRVLNPGDIEVLAGGVSFQDGLVAGNATNTVTIGTNGVFSLWSSAPAFLPSLVFKEKGTLYSTAGVVTPGQASGNAKNIWAGPVSLGGMIANKISKGYGMTFTGTVTGPGGFLGGQGGLLQFTNPGNTFEGGVSVTGITGTGDLCVTGGVAVTAKGAIPQDGSPIVLTNACLYSFASPSNTFPDLVAHGKTVVTSVTGLASCTFKSLTKTGSGPLTIFGPAKILGDADIRDGTLRFGSRLPESGLNWWHANSPLSLDWTAPIGPYYGVANGVDFAYRSWPYYHDGYIDPKNGKPASGHYYNAFFYTGYIRIPGEEGTQVTCNFVSSLARGIRIDVGGKTVVKMNDNTDALTGKKLGWDRLYVGPQVTLTAGWQTFLVSMANSWDTTAGPIANTALGWVANFGAGVDWEGRCVTNADNYVKFIDPGDGSFLRPALDNTVLNAENFRPTFAGAVAFAPGTVLDINDTAPYMPVEVPSLTGVPTIKNGEISVTDPLWTLRSTDVIGGKPLTVTSGATLRFAPNTVFTVTDAEGLPQGAKTYPLLRVENGGSLVNAPSYERPAGGKWYAVWSTDGSALDLEYHDDLMLIIR